MISKYFAYLEEAVLNLLITFMTLLVFIEVIARFFFSTGSLWIQELTLTFSAWFVLFGMSYGVKVGAHIGVDALINKLPTKAKRVTSIAAVLICLSYCLMFLKGSWDYLSQMYQVGIPMEDIHFPHWLVNQLDPDTAWDVFKIDVEEPRVPIWLSQSILILGFTMLFWRLFELLISLIKGDVSSFALADEAKESMHLVDESAQSQSNTKE